MTGCSSAHCGGSFVPEDLLAAPAEALQALGDVLDVPPRAIFDYAVRAPTRAEHRLLVRAHAGFRPLTERELDALQDRLVEVALEHERPSLLLARICELLRLERVERTGLGRQARGTGSSGLSFSHKRRCVVGCAR